MLHFTPDYFSGLIKLNAQLRLINRTRTENLGLRAILGVMEHDDNLRSKTPPEDSIQIFPSQFGSYSVRVLTENRLYTRAHAQTLAHMEKK